MQDTSNSDTEYSSEHSDWSITTENGNKYNNQLQEYQVFGWPKGYEWMASPDSDSDALEFQDASAHSSPEKEPDDIDDASHDVKNICRSSGEFGPSQVRCNHGQTIGI